MEFSEACSSLVNVIQQGDNYEESYSLMLMTFMDAKRDGETNSMALALAKESINDSKKSDT